MTTSYKYEMKIANPLRRQLAASVGESIAAEFQRYSQIGETASDLIQWRRRKCGEASELAHVILVNRLRQIERLADLDGPWPCLTVVS